MCPLVFYIGAYVYRKMRFKTDLEKFVDLIIYVPFSSGLGSLCFNFSELIGMKAVEFHTFLEQTGRQTHSISVIYNPWGFHINRAINHSSFGNS
jgi:hypothetical protein